MATAEVNSAMLTSLQNHDSAVSLVILNGEYFGEFADVYKNILDVNQCVGGNV